MAARGGNFRVATLLWPGEYFVRVTPWVKFSGQFDVGSYNLHAEGMSASPVNLSLNGPPRGGSIEAREDQDYFRIEVTEPTAVAPLHERKPRHSRCASWLGRI